MNPKVSAVIPTYQRAIKVQRAVESILAQTFSDIEIIVVDDGSSDGTQEALRNAFGHKIRYFSQTNQGVSVARNKGIAEARGEWIAFLDSDDTWEKQKLEWQFRALEQFGSQCGACYTDTQLFNHPETRTLFQMAQGSYRHDGMMGINTEALRLLVKPGGGGMVIHLSSLTARTDLLRSTGGFDPKLLYSQDSELMFRLAMRTGFCYVNRPLVWFDRSPVATRHVGVSSEWDKTDFFLRDSELRLEGLIQLGDALPLKIQKLIREQLRTVHSGWANWYLETGEYRKARKAVSRAARMDLTFNIAVKWLLTWMNPRLALRMVRHHQVRTRESSSIV